MYKLKRKAVLGVLLVLFVTTFTFGCSSKEVNSTKKEMNSTQKEKDSTKKDNNGVKIAKNVRDFIDPEITAPLDMLPPELAEITRESLNDIRAMMEPMLKAKGVEGVKVDKKEIDTKDGKVTVYIYEKEDSASTDKPGVLWTHGGGYILGSGETDFAGMLAKELDAVVVSVDYRLAPEHPFPAGHNDSYNAFLWMVENAKELGVDSSRIAIGGDSAGAGMAAGIAIHNRDKNGPEIALELLLYPMLDNLHDTPSGSVEDYPVWSRKTSFNAWEMYLNGTPGLEASPYASPARAKDLTGLPKTFITVGAVDLFRDEVIDYAQRLMAVGVPTELAVYPGMYHSGEVFVPTADISQKMSGNYFRAIKEALNVK
ncbi:alpha/beta hydrolase [Oceanirhabdus seepicola]|uniref:Alpha/beta hydrolase n=1 Tax=Oceanirhabdus seepicola TaxID=2828781 RepID=A0A9J6P8N4_9CLOT|nr:alpha/beta hydrolase [Oceanirhabdus seepicola]MCM1991800.1 alpha/beta hydrolase [Oceanirhabdus seepicola]